MLCFILFIFMHLELGVCISIIGMANMPNVGGAGAPEAEVDMGGVDGNVG